MDKINSTDNNFPSLTKSTSTSSNNGIGDEAESIWSPDIEQSFLEALAIYPPCGRRKIILTEEGKMYGRNELVARYIKIRTGKIRTRKQVSSHLQVLAKRRSKDLQDLRNDKQAQKIILDRLKQYTSAEIVSLNLDNKNDEQKPIDIVKKSGTSIKNSTHNPFPNTKRRSSTNIDHLKLDAETLSKSSNNMITGVGPSQMPVIKKSTTKNLTSNGSVPNMINNSVTHFLPASPILNSYGSGRSRCSSNASSLSCRSASSINHMVNHPIILPLAIIGDENFRLYELSAFIELKRTISSTHSSLIYPYSESCSIYQHDLLRLHSNDIQIKNVHTFETISIDQIFDKFPHYDGLKDLFERNPDGSFFLIKFWADVSISPSIINSIINRDESFFTSYTYASCSNRPIHISTRLCSFGKQVLEKVEISEYPQRDQFDQFIYRFDRSPLCDYMVQFIQKLRSLPNTYMMNSVLENFTILQVIKCRDDSERLLLCLAFVFEIAMFDGGGPQYQVYKLVAS